MNFIILFIALFVTIDSLAQDVDISSGPVTLYLEQTRFTAPNPDLSVSRFCDVSRTCDLIEYPISVTLVAKQGLPATLTVDYGASWQYDDSTFYNGHTLYMHGINLPAAMSGYVQDTGPIDDVTYSLPNFTTTGSYLYYCHVHKIKHMEMGEIGALIVRPVDQTGAYLPYINNNGNDAPYNRELRFVLGSVDTRYHGNNNNSGPIGDNVIFSSYAPTLFLLNGEQGSSSGDIGSFSLTAGSILAIRIFGTHSVNALFDVVNNQSVKIPFQIYNKDGIILTEPQTVTELTVSPGETYDILLSMPNESIFPEVTFHNLYNNSAYPNSNRYYSIAPAN